MSEWPLVIDGDDYSPIPESWLSWGYDDGREGETRLYAVSAAVPTPAFVKIRYAHPTTPKVLVAETAAAQNSAGDGYIPASLANRRTWPRSTTPQGQPPSDVARDPEFDHLRELWGERVDAIPSPDESAGRVVADGGRARAIAALVGPAQGHLGHQGGGRDA